MSNIQQFFLRYFYLGNSKYAPGTVTSFCITVLWYFVPNIFLVQLSIVMVHIVLGFYFCYTFTSCSDEDDPGYIVIDEVVGMMIALFLLPKVLSVYIISFILFRCQDILKPSFIYRSQNFGFGIGIMLDDVIAGLIVVLILQGLYI